MLTSYRTSPQCNLWLDEIIVDNFAGGGASTGMEAALGRPVDKGRAMKPFLTFRAPDEIKTLYQPKGRKKFRVNIWVLLPNRTERDCNEIIVSEPIYLSDLKPILDEAANELIDLLNAENWAIWAEFMHSINDNTTNEVIDNFCENFPTSDYGFECYIWR